MQLNMFLCQLHGFAIASFRVLPHLYLNVMFSHLSNREDELLLSEIDHIKKSKNCVSLDSGATCSCSQSMYDYGNNASFN